MASLGVNIDHIANLREARQTTEPDPVPMALLAELGGADGITVHLREDRRHINERDVKLLRDTIQSRLNLEMAATKEMLDIALEIQPDLITLVPERREEITTEGGLDILGQMEKIEPIIKKLTENSIPVSLFIDPELEQVEASSKTTAKWIELHTGNYANASIVKKEFELSRLIKATNKAGTLGLRTNAGHGLTYQNVEAIAAIPDIEELNIGHTIISRAMAVGLEQAVRQMKQLVTHPRKNILF